MPTRLPPLNGLRLFEAAARCGSLKRAAHELNLTPGALTHGIDALEQWLDVQLFERQGRGVVLTAAGRQYLPYVTEGLSVIATGTLRLPNRSSESRLSISSCSLFAHKLLLPRLHKFREAYPKLEVTVDERAELVELPSSEFDLGIRSGNEAWPKLSCDLLGRMSSVPVGSPGYIRELSRDGTLDWSRATLIHNSTASDDWESWRRQSKTETAGARTLVVSSSQLALEAAIGGLGLAIGGLTVIDDDIAAGRLAIAVNRAVPFPLGFWLVRPLGAEIRREIAAFRNWLLQEMSQLAWNDQYGARDTARARQTLRAAVIPKDKAAARRRPSVPPAQKPIRIGLLPLGSPSNEYDRSLVDAIRSGLRQASLIENRDIVLDVVWTHGGDADRAVAELIHRGAELLVPAGSTASAAAISKTSTIPIVFLSVGDPLGLGLVENLAQPGGNATGFSDSLLHVGKLVQLAGEISKQETIDYLWHTAWPDGRNRLDVAEKAARSAGVKLRPRGIVESAEIGSAISAMKRDGAKTVVVQPSPFTYQQRAPIIRAASQSGLPTLFCNPEAARDGALIGYGPDYIPMNRRAPFYIDQVLKGAKPADLPVEQPAKIDLLVNPKTAKMLGLKMPRHFSFAPIKLVAGST